MKNRNPVHCIKFGEKFQVFVWKRDSYPKPWNCVKGKIALVHVMSYRGVAVQLHSFLTSPLNGVRP
jgi:hypothetical protein